MFHYLDTGLYVCSNCNRYIPSVSKKDCLQHKQDFHRVQFDQLVENQRFPG